jgi:hypothetical protein
VMTGRNTPFSSSTLATQRFRTSGLNIKTRSSPEFQSRNAAHNISGYSIHTKPARPDAIRHQCLGVSTSTDRHERETQRLLLVQATTLLPSQHARQRPFYQWCHAPVSGKFVGIRPVPGTCYSESLYQDFMNLNTCDPSALTNSSHTSLL